MKKSQAKKKRAKLNRSQIVSSSARETHPQSARPENSSPQRPRPTSIDPSDILLANMMGRMSIGILVHPPIPSTPLNDNFRERYPRCSIGG
jgi:hypothetical protein